MKVIKRHSVKLYLALAVAGLVVLWLWPSLVAAMPLTARHNLERAWRLAADVGRYSYQSTVVQTKHPTLTLSNVGRTARTEHFVIEGQLDRPADLMTMNIAAANQTPLEVKVEQGQAYGRMHGVDGMEEWTEVEAGSDLFAPGGDPLGFLAVVENVEQVGHDSSRTTTESELFPAEMLPVALADSMTRYQFDVSGPKYAQHMRASLEQMLRDRGELPGGMTLQTPQQYVDLTGQGEIWISDNGLPMHQIIRLEFPPEPGSDVWIETEITTNFSDWQEPGPTYALLQGIPRIIENPSILTKDLLSLFPNLHTPLARLQLDDLQAFGLLLGLSLLLAALALLAVTHRRSPKFYAGLSFSIIALMLVTPILQSHQAHATNTRFYAHQAQAKQQHAEIAAQTEETAPAFNPNQDPLAKISPLPNPLPAGEGIVTSPPLGGIEGGRVTVNNQFTIDNSQSTIHNSSPTLIPQLQGSPCVITATSDCDGDGLTDNVEIYELGTRIDLIDSDNDGISDKTEVAPFSINGQAWYLDPLNADSNGDGLTDGAECLGRIDVVTSTLSTPLEATCTDTDTDGIPDVHDFDDDGDGVPDSSDMAHLDSQTVLSQTFNLNITGATANKNLFVDFQIRPTDERHLWWTNSALNWPDKDTSGQIMRVTTDTLATEGDMVMMPMLEIVIPYSAANPAGGLPISGTTTITATTPISNWIDTDVVQKYNLTVMGGANAERVVYLPLNVVTDPNGGTPLAWQARMPYKLAAGVSSWGAAHQVKLIWLVSGQTDHCDTGCADPANWTSQSTVLQTYYDDFVVTGIEVQEHHGAEALMVRQNNRTGHYEPELWHLADTLQFTYLDAQTVGGNRLRLSDLSSTYGSWGLSGLSFNYIGGLADEVALLEATTGDAVPAFLRSGGNPADGTVASVLLLGEETNRFRTMGEVDISGSGDNINITERFTFANNTFTVDLGSASLETSAAMRIKPYKFSTDTGWAEEGLDTFLPALKTRLETVFTSGVMTNLLAGDSVTDPTRARDGAILLAINTYFSLSIPTVSTLVSDGTLISGQPLVNSNHQRPAEPAAAIVQRLATDLKTFFGIRNLNDLNIPTVDNSKRATAAPSWGALAASRGKVLEGFGDVLQGNSMSSETLALLEIANYPNTIDTTNLIDSSVYAILDFVLRDFISGTVQPALLGRPASENTNDRRCASVACIGSAIAGTTIYTGKKIYANAFVNRRRVAKIKIRLGRISQNRQILAKAIKDGTPNNVFAQYARKNIANSQKKLAKIITKRLKVFVWSGVAIQLVSSGATIAIVLATGQVEADSPAFSRLLAEQITAVQVEVLQVVLYFYALSTGNFYLLAALAILAVVDTIIAVVCELTGANNNETVARWVCGGITGALAQGLAYVINDTTPLVDFTRDDRLKMVIDTPTIGTESGLGGVIVGNSITFSGVVTNTLYMDDPNWLGYSYGWQWSDNNLDDATFAYKFQPSQQEIPLNLRQVNWDSVPGKKPYSISANDARFRKQFTIQPLTYNLTTPSINQGLDFHFSEGFAVRQQNCWLVPAPFFPPVVPVCWLSKFDSTSHEAMNNQFIFDVLPGNVDDFRTLALNPSTDGKNGYRLAWDSQFPTLADADGDGLRSQAMGGVDPDDSNPDSDADGLSDYFELSVTGYDPARADTDCDGLTDYWELFYNTNPALADSDGDGLRDGDEFQHPNRLYPYENGRLTNLNAPSCAGSNSPYTGGWQIVYDFDSSGNPLVTWVNANPLDPDSDDDALTDQQERIYAYNPNVASTLKVLRLDSQIQTDSGTMPFVSPGGTINYTAQITNELRLPYARGLLEAELPLDNVLNIQSLGAIAPQSSVTANGSLSVAAAGLSRSGSVDMGIRAGATLDDPTGRVLWLHLSEPVGSTTFIDDSFLQNNATCTGSSCPTANGQILTFDGNDAVIVPDNDTLDMSQYTLALAVKPTTSGTKSTLLRRGATSGPATYNLALLLELTANNEVDFSTFYNNCVNTTGNRLLSPALPLNEWSHITASYDGSMKKLYLNGVLVASVAYNRTPCASNASLSIGAMLYGSSLFDGFTGQIDEVEIFPTVLNDATILARYATPILQLNLRDGATWGSSAVSCSGADCPTASGNGAVFGQVDHLNVTAPDLSGDRFAFTTWIKPQNRTAPMNSEVATAYGKNTDRDWQGVFGNMVYDNTQTSWPYARTIYPTLFVSSDGALRMTMANNGATCEVTTNSTNLVTNGIWQHLSVSYDGSNFTFYVNGEAVIGGATGSCAAVTPPTVSTMYIGRPNNYGYAWIDKLNITAIASGAPGELRDPHINRNSDSPSGNIWELNNISTTGVRNIDKTFFVFDSNEWIRLYQDNRKEWNGYESTERFGGRPRDRNWVHLTGIRNTTRLGMTDYTFNADNASNEGKDTGALTFGVFNDYFAGELDDFRVYNYPLSAELAADVYNSSLIALDIPFDEAPGSTVFADESGNYTGVTCSGNACPLSGIAGRLNQALEFDGVNDYLTIGSTASEVGFTRDSFSAMMWINPHSFRGNFNNGIVPLISINENYRLWLGPVGQMEVRQGGDSAIVSNANSLFNNVNRWYHLAYVFERTSADRGIYRFYVNGQLIHTQSFFGPIDGAIEIGRDKGVYYDGLMDDLTVVRRALTQNEVRVHLNRAPAINLHLDEDLSLTSFADDSENRYTATCSGATCPKAGDKGQIREAVTFDGSDLLTLADTTNVTSLTDFSVGLWVKPTKTVNGVQRLMTKASGNFFNANFRLLLLANSMTVRFDRQHTCLNSEGNWHIVDATNPLIEDQWNHVVATHDTVKGEMKIYINGALAGTTSSTGSSVCTAANPVRLGQSFYGGMDEVSITPAVMSADAVRDTYTYQASWFDVINPHTIFVDAEPPTVDLTLTPSHLSTAQTVLYIGAEDASSPIAKVEYRINSGAWQEATPSTPDRGNSQGWLFSFQQAAGSHTIEARATDAVGNVSNIASAMVQVDDQSPTLTLNTTNNPVRGLTSQPFNGTVSDSESGVVNNNVNVTTVDRTGATVSGNQPATVSGGTWQATQPFLTSPYGLYTTTVSAVDQVGNTTTTSSLVKLDGLPPYADVTEAENYLTISTSKTITGVASDVPYPSTGRTLHLHFETGPGLWVDGSDTGFVMQCSGTTCPTTGVTGKRGNAITFDGGDDQLTFTTVEPVTTTTTAEQLGLSGGSFTVMAWVRANNWSGGNAILGSNPTTSTDNFYLGIQNGSPILGHNSDDTQMIGTIPTNEWTHVTWRFDATSGERAFFVNGTVGLTSTGHSVFSATDTIEVGQARNGNAYAGSLDELVIYAQPLADETIYDIANPLDVNIRKLELRIRPYADRNMGQFAGNWNDVTLNSSNALYTTWDYTLSNLAGGTYKIDLRVTDSVGNSSFVDGAWDVAVVAPDLTISKTSVATIARTSDTISYTIAYTNVSPAIAPNVVITEIVPVDTSFTATLSHPGWTCLPNGSACGLILGDLQASATGTISFAVTVTDTWSPGMTSISNTVTIASDGTDGTPANNSASHQIPIDGSVDLSVSLTDGGSNFPYDPDQEGPPLVYTITYTNSGTQPAQPQLSVVWSEGGDINSAGVPGWTCTVDVICTRSLGDLNVGQTGTVTFGLYTSFFVPDNQLVSTTVTIADLAGATEVITGNNTASEITPINVEYAIAPATTTLTVQEGSTVTNSLKLLYPPDITYLEFSPTFPGPSVGTVYDIDFDNFTWKWQYATTDGPEQTQPVTLSVMVNEGAFFLNTVFSMTVENVAPNVAITGNNTVASGTLYNLNLGQVIDPGNDTVTACSLNWGDGNSVDCFASLGGGMLTHTYGISYVNPIITVNLTDEDGTHVAASKTITVTGLTPSFGLDQTNITTYESITATNSGTYSPADANLTWLASEGTVTHTNGLWSWSLPPGSAESSRPVTITAGSQTISFTLTMQGDGVPSNIEAGAPNSGDGNNDGVLDQAQMHVASLPSPLTNEYVTLVASPGMTLTNVSLTPTPSAGDGSQPAGIQFPLGYLNFDLTGMGTGGKANVALLISGTNNINSYGQYDTINGWYTFLYDNAIDTGAELVSNERIVLYLVDGNRGDRDGSANGTVANLGGPANQQQPKTLTVNISGSGSVSPLAGEYAQDTVLTMKATPDPGWRFDSWSGALSGSAISQSLTMNQDKTVTAIFVQETYTLVDQVVGNGSISLNPDQSSYGYGDVVTTTATANLGWTFDGWSGDLSGSTVSQSVTIDGNKSITATFTQDAYTVTTTTNGNGRVILKPDQASYRYNDQITMVARPDPGYTFQGWSGDLNSDAPTENLTITSSKTITALFTTAVYSVETSVLGNGSITVTPTKTSYSYGEVVTATATPALGWSFSQWVVGLSGVTTTQSFTVTGDTTLLAAFKANDYTLSAGWTGNGGVTVTPNQTTFGYGEVVTVTATPGTGWTFDSWSGASSETALTTTVTMTGDQSILATFEPFSYTLTVTKTGTGSGQVTTALPAIDCGSDCSEQLDYGTVITLTATSDPGSSFSGWRGDAGESSTNPLTVTVTGETIVTATFTAENVNSAPVLSFIANQTVDEEQLVSFTAVATDTDVPTQTLTFSLSDTPIGATISSTTGLFSWVTTEIDGPGVYSATIIVSDGILTDSQVVEITVNEVNEMPALTFISNQSVLEGETLSFTATATDSDVPTQTLTYSLSNAPVGATISPTTGLFTWPTDADDGPAVYSATVIVSDGLLTDSQTINISVTEDEAAPVLALIGPQSITETLTLTFTAVATDANNDTLTFSLSNAPIGAIISPTTGLFSWATTETDGPGVYSATVIVSDGILTDSQVVAITVNEVNDAPVLTFISDQNVLEGETLSFTATATDSDVPTQTLTYSLSNAPVGATISSTTGLFTWPTNADDGPAVYSATISVSDGLLTDSQTINISVTEDEAAPILAMIGPQSITETLTLTFTAVATDANDDTLTFSLSNPSTGMSLDTTSGLFTWTPTETQGPGTYLVSLIVSDTTGLTDTTVVMITVNELNEAPVLTPISDQTLTPTRLFTLPLTATDSDLPANTLTYTMTNAPVGASLDEITGLFSWTPTETQGPDTYSVTFIVSDDGSPVLTASQTVNLTVTDAPDVLITESGGSTDVDEDRTILAGYHVVLKTQPSEAVTITINTDSQVETSQTTLIFTSANWDKQQTVLVSAIDDAVYEGPHTGTISHTVSSLDNSYDGRSLLDLVVSITDNDSLPSLDISDVTVDEAVGTTSISVTLTGESVFPASVDYTISDGSATGNGVDYSGSNGTLTWLANTTTTQALTLTIVDDLLYEPDETVNITLANPINATINTATGVLTITDNDAAPDLQLGKTANSNAVLPGDILVYTLIFTNVGELPANNVVLTETVPVSTTFQAAASSLGWDCADGSPAGTVCTQLIGTLAANGDTGQVDFAVTVNDPLAASLTHLDNSATIGDDGTNGSDLNLSDNQTSITTSVINTATLTLIKEATPEDGTDFTFTSTLPGYASFNLDDELSQTDSVSQSITVADLVIGTYQITETLPADWQLDSATCTGGSDPGSLITETLTIALGAGETVVCTLTNTFTPPIVINSRLDLASPQTDYDSTPVPNAPYGVFTITANFRNNSTETLENLHFEVVDLTNGNVLLNADGGPAGPGAIISVPPAALGPDEVLSPNETFTIDFEIGLTSTSAFDFFVDAYGLVMAEVTILSTARNDSFHFRIGAEQLKDTHPYYFPIIVK